MKKIIGIWELTSANIIINNEKISTFSNSRKMIKIFTETHFSFFSKDINRTNFKGYEPTVEEKLKAYETFDSGAGTYTIKNDLYSESIEYCSHPNYENKTIDFKITIDNNKLIQEGNYPLVTLGLGDSDGYLIETYKRIK